jgi:hypothetical protein
MTSMFACDHVCMHLQQTCMGQNPSGYDAVSYALEIDGIFSRNMGSSPRVGRRLRHGQAVMRICSSGGLAGNVSYTAQSE